MPSAYCPYNVEKIISAMKRLGYVVFEGEYDLNIVGVRTNDLQANTFNDWICIFHKRKNGVWAFYAFQATTDPGVYWRENPMNVKGVAILMPGQYQKMWKDGEHKGYPAFQQNTPVIVARDNDGDNVLEIDPNNLDQGMFGINGHHASYKAYSTYVDKWSAGCQVWADIDDHNFAMVLAKRQAAAGLGDEFTYTLLTENQIS